jgi:hypothetical protein
MEKEREEAAMRECDHCHAELGAKRKTVKVANQEFCVCDTETAFPFGNCFTRLKASLRPEEELVPEPVI